MGAVHIESNDILLHLENRFPTPAMIASDTAKDIAAFLKHEDDLHLDLRALSFRFLFTPPAPPKSLTDLTRYAATGSGTVGGVPDAGKAREIDFWKAMQTDGITDTVARTAAGKFRNAFDEINERLAEHPFLFGDSFGLLDIAWIVYAERLRLAGYPIARLHPRLATWLSGQAARPEIAPEITLPTDLADGIATRQSAAATRGETMEAVCFG